MSRFVRVLAPVAGVVLALAAPAEAATSAMATYGANSAIVRPTQVTACDGENDAYGVAAQVMWSGGIVYTYNNFGGAVTCKTFAFGGTFSPVAVRACETLRRTGIQACGRWAYTTAPV